MTWTLTEEALGRLLERLGADPETAGQAYQSLRTRLLDYFDWRGILRPEVAADETLDRVARRLEESEPVAKVESYAYGVARLVLFEQLRLQDREQHATAALAREQVAGRDTSEEERRDACLSRCLQALPAADRDLIVAYYDANGAAREARQRLAERLGIRYATLKTRAHRVRLRLELCLRDCLPPGDAR